MGNVEIFESEARSGTFLISQGLEMQHHKLIELVRKYKDDFEDFSPLKGRKFKSTGGRAANEMMLTEDHFLFLSTLIRNTKISVSLKKAIVKDYSKVKKQLESIQKRNNAPKHIETREAGKLVRKQTTDAMQDFVQYGIDQGGSVKGCNMYYSNITRMLNGLLFIVEGKHKNLRDVMTTRQLMTVSSAEQIVDRGLIIGMSKKRFYKDIYQDVKDRVLQFAELHGKSDVIEHELLLIETE